MKIPATLNGLSIFKKRKRKEHKNIEQKMLMNREGIVGQRIRTSFDQNRLHRNIELSNIKQII